MIVSIIIVAVLSTCTTYIISINLNRGPVLASALVTLVSGIILPLIFVDGASLAVIAATGSYAGMVTKEKFSSIWDMVFIGLITGILSILAKNVFVGVGGKLGTIAAISGLTYLGLISFRMDSKI